MCPRYGSEKYCRRTNSTICRRLKMYRYILVYFSFFCSNFENKVLAKLPQNRPRDTYTIPENGRTVRVHRSIVSGQKSVSTEKKKKHCRISTTSVAYFTAIVGGSCSARCIVCTSGLSGIGFQKRKRFAKGRPRRYVIGQ